MCINAYNCGSFLFVRKWRPKESDLFDKEETVIK